jgi:beta-glucosidase
MKKFRLHIILLVLMVSSLKLGPGYGQTPERPIYKNPSYPINQRIDDLISKMTLEEKVGQLNMPTVYSPELGKNRKEKIAGCFRFAEGTFTDVIGPGGGLFGWPGGSKLEHAKFYNDIQRIATEKTRLKIPVLFIEEATHGVCVSGGTVFPEGLTMGSTWNMGLIEKVYSAVAAEARPMGVHEMCTLVIEPIRDPRLGRAQEGFCEDPFLYSKIAKAIVNGCQGYDISGKDKVIALLTDFPGQTEPVSGFNVGAMEISERTLREIFMPPWEAAIKEAGALGVMASYCTINGDQTHSSSFLMTDLLRDELNFQGIIVSEGAGVNMITRERLAKTDKEAGAMAANAGLDVSISFGQGYLREMVENVDEGKVSMHTIDRSVRRVLRTKYMLGLFDNPYVDTSKVISHTKENQDLALQAAHEGIVLLKNDNKILPIKKSIRSIAVIGPNADNAITLLGDYTSGLWGQDVKTVLKSIQNKVGSKTEITYVKGCNVIGNELNEIDKAKEAAKNADIAIVVLGEGTDRSTDGEDCDVASLDLTGLQEELLKAVHSTGKPTVVVLINGRPLSTRWAAENSPAILEAWIPGEKGGEAVADILFGDYNPDGKLAITIPRHVGQLPVYYNYKSSKAAGHYVDMPATPLYDFGYGLSYTDFAYENLVITPAVTGIAGNVTVNATIRNIGKTPGAEVVQLYLRDKITSVVTADKQLKAFTKVFLNPGEEKTVSFTLTEKEFSLLDASMHWKAEPGEFDVMIGSSSSNILLNGIITLQ